MHFSFIEKALKILERKGDFKRNENLKAISPHVNYQE